MPEPPKPDESEDEFISRCMAYMKSNHAEMPAKQQAAICYSMWRKSKGIKENTIDAHGFIIGTCETPLKFIATNLMPDKITTTGNTQITEKSEWVSKKMIAMRGDTFLDGGFFSNEEAARVVNYWNGTLHDIDHKGWGKLGTDITYFIGYHKNAEYDMKTKELKLDLLINTRAERYQAWQTFLDICEAAGKYANVSVSYLAMVRYVNATQLPKDVNYKEMGYNDDSMVPCLVNVIPIAISTVLYGKCSGCSLNADDAPACSCKTCVTKPEDNATEAERKEFIEKLQKDDLIREITKEEN